MPTDLAIDAKDSPGCSRRTISSGEILGRFRCLGFDGWRNLGTYDLSEIFLIFRTGFPGIGLRYNLMRALRQAPLKYRQCKYCVGCFQWRRILQHRAVYASPLASQARAELKRFDKAEKGGMRRKKAA